MAVSCGLGKTRDLEIGSLDERERHFLRAGGSVRHFQKKHSDPMTTNCPTFLLSLCFRFDLRALPGSPIIQCVSLIKSSPNKVQSTYDRRSVYFRAFVVLACIMIWMRWLTIQPSRRMKQGRSARTRVAGLPEIGKLNGRTLYLLQLTCGVPQVQGADRSDLDGLCFFSSARQACWQPRCCCQRSSANDQSTDDEEHKTGS